MWFQEYINILNKNKVFFFLLQEYIVVSLHVFEACEKLY